MLPDRDHSRQATTNDIEGYFEYKRSLAVFLAETHAPKKAGVENIITGRLHDLKEGDPFFDVMILHYQSKTLREDKIPNMPSLELLTSKICEWIEWQLVIFENANLNEFRRTKDPKENKFFAGALVESLLHELGEISVMDFNYNPDLILRFCNNFHSLLKKLIAIYRDDKGPGLKDLMIQMMAIKFETYLYKCNAYIKKENYIAAEISANKAIANLGHICTTERQLLRCVLLGKLAYIKSMQHDAESTIQYLKLTFPEIQTLKDKSLFQTATRDSYFSSACEYAADNFLGTNAIDKAIKYLQTAIDYECSLPTKARLVKKLESLTPRLTSQIHDMVKEENYNYCKLSVYPDRHLICFTFTEDKNAQLAKKHIHKNGITLQDFKKDVVPLRIGFAITVDSSFDIERLIVILDRVKELIRKEQVAEEKKLQIDNNTAVVKNEDDVTPNKTVEYERHPKTATKKKSKKKVANQELVVEVVKPTPKWLFLDSIKPAPLRVVEFTKCGKVFDPKNPTGVVTLRVNNMSGNWFACINPDLLNELQGNVELAKIMERFQKEIELGNDCCVPCAKEMKLKEKSLGDDFPYLFKIRLLGKGNGNIRIYAKLIEVTPDGKSLVAFTAIDPKSHSKDSRPIEVPMPTAGALRKNSK